MLMPAPHIFSPNFSEEAVQKFAVELYGIDVSVKQLDSYIDQNFLLQNETGQKFVLKIANAGEKKEILDLQNRATANLKTFSETTFCPGIIPALNGEQIISVTNTGGTTYWVRLLTYLEGEFLANIFPQTPELLGGLGRFLGDMDKKLAEFYHPAAWRKLPWDLKHATELNHLTHYIADPQQRRLVEYFLLQFDTCVRPRLPELRSSVIHNDANDYNILVGKNRSGDYQVTGIIDFGDMVQTFTVCELAIAATYIMFCKENPLKAACQVIRGYHEMYPLTELEIELLFYLIATRLCNSLCMSAYQKSLEPENEYISISEKAARELLEKMIAINPEQAHREFRKTCGMVSSPSTGLSKEEILQIRREYLGRNLSISYQKPLKIVRGAMQYLFDDSGKTYLDCVNNVPHVGHSHPRVVRAAQRQMVILNTNTRYLHNYIVEYARRLTATLPEPLRVCFFVNSGSEANDLALRLARTYTGKIDCIVVDGAYHGHTCSLIELSPYKFDGPGGQGAPLHTRKVVMPDIYRGPYKADDSDAGNKYARFVREAVAEIHRQGRSFAAFFCESLLSCGGQIVLPEGYLKAAYQHIRKAGGVCIADEVQVGFGRVGTHFWGFRTQDVVPDIVTLGKPIGNAHPLAAVITTPQIAEAFYTGMEYFNTFGGNPVSCAVGLAVLDVLEEERLQENALAVGEYLKKSLEKLKEKYRLIGDVRGLGLFIGVEFVENQETLEPAAAKASEIVNQMKERGVLLSTDGPLHNVIKIKPPMVFSQANADLLVTTLDAVLAEIS
jgi:4-aminobutyrate aminotransferase-like enzyme/Ser/Thr protein kinase RdoA (MazF antagonist)